MVVLISNGASEHCSGAIINLPPTMDAHTLRLILKEEIAVVQQTFSDELASVKRSMAQQTADITASYREDLREVRLEQQALRQAVDFKLQAVHNAMLQLQVDGSRPSTTTSQQTFTSHISDGPQQLPDDISTGNVAAWKVWNAQTGAPIWAPGAEDTEERNSAADTMNAHASDAVPQGHSVPLDPADPGRNRKRCMLCHGVFKHKRGARQHMMKAFQQNAICKFIQGYPPHERILQPFEQATNQQAGPAAAWKLAVRTFMNGRQSA
jgi:hypothetical protein